MKGWSSEYYKLPEGAVELQDLIEYREMNFSVGNIFKAAYRLGHKDGTDAEYDLRKIIWFAQRELDRIRRQERIDHLQACADAMGDPAEVDVHSFMRALRRDPDQ